MWVRIELRAFAFTRHPASPRPHAVNEENAALRKAIARRRRRADCGAREGADGPELGLRGALVPVRVPIVWLDTRPLSVAQGRAACVIPQQVRAAFAARQRSSSRSSTTSRRWSTRPSTQRSRRAGSSSRPVLGSKTQTAPRRRCAPPALAPPCRPAAETRARSRVRRASRHASAGASLSPPPNKWCLAQSGSQCAAALSGCPTFPPAPVHDWEAPAF